MPTHQTHTIHKPRGFTLVELIIVITILSILSFISFLSFKNYYNSTRDSVRVTDIKTIFEGLTLYKIKSGNYPLPDNPISISAGNNLLTYQGEIGNNIKQIISLHGKGVDPKDQTNYIYSTDKSFQKGQLMGYLENGEDIKHFSLLPLSYATNNSHFSQKLVYIYGDKLGIITDTYKTPLQFLNNFSSGVNLLDDTYSDKELITYIGGDVGDGGKSTSTGNVLAEEIEHSLQGTLACGTKSINGYSLSPLSHNQSYDFNKQIDISYGNQILQLHITCVNGEFDIANATESILNTVCESGYVPYNNSCILNACQGNIPLHATSTATSENHQGSWNYQENPGECSFQCNLNYTYDTISHTCLPDSRIQACGSIPNHSIYNSVSSISQTWNENEWTPSILSVYNVISSSSKCQFACNAGYTYDIASGQCIGNNCTIPSTDTFNGKIYNILSPGILLHNNNITKTGTYSFGASPSNGAITANFEYNCNAGVLSTVSTTNNAGSCNSGYSFNNNYSSPACGGNSCTTPTSGVHNGLNYSLISQTLSHGNSVTITSINRPFGTSPTNGNTSAQFTFSCNAGVLSPISTANNAGSCNSGYSFNNNYSSPACEVNARSFPTKQLDGYSGNSFTYNFSPAITTSGNFTYNFQIIGMIDNIGCSRGIVSITVYNASNTVLASNNSLRPTSCSTPNPYSINFTGIPTRIVLQSSFGGIDGGGQWHGWVLVQNNNIIKN